MSGEERREEGGGRRLFSLSTHTTHHATPTPSHTVCPSLTIVEHHTRASRSCPASGGRVSVASAVRWSRVASPAPVMDYTFDISPITVGGGEDGDGSPGIPGTRIVYAAEIEVRVPVPLPARARAAIEDSMVDSFDTLCDRFIRYAATKLGCGDPVRVAGAGGRSSSDSFGEESDVAADTTAAAGPATPRLTINTGASDSIWRRTSSLARAGSADSTGVPTTPTTPGGRHRRVSVDLKHGATFVEGDVFYDAREE